METLAELKAKIAELTRQADELLRLEKASVIEEVKRKIVDYNISAREIGLDVSPQPPVKAKIRSASRSEKPEVKYRDEHGNEWSGGRGRRPYWVQEIIDSGGDIEKYRVTDR